MVYGYDTRYETLSSSSYTFFTLDLCLWMNVNPWLNSACHLNNALINSQVAYRKARRTDSLTDGRLPQTAEKWHARFSSENSCQLRRRIFMVSSSSQFSSKAEWRQPGMTLKFWKALHEWGCSSLKLRLSIDICVSFLCNFWCEFISFCRVMRICLTIKKKIKAMGQRTPDYLW